MKEIRPFKMLRNAFHFSNNFQDKIKGREVSLKPNLNTQNVILPIYMNKWIVTSKDILSATISLVQELGMSSVIFSERAFIGFHVKKIYKDIRLTKELKNKDVNRVDLSKGQFQKIELFENISENGIVMTQKKNLKLTSFFINILKN
ncbi:MAG: hypothetical protein ACFFD2_04865 [Promethearchaeota archaeon]